MNTAVRPLRINIHDNLEKIALWVLLAIVAGGSLALFGSGGGDDSHITWWVVDELRRTGRILNLNGAPIEQSSSIGLVLIMAILRIFLRLPTPELGVILSIAGTVATCWMSAKVASRFSQQLALPTAWLVATSGPLVYWGTSGMETSVAAFAAVWLLDAIGRCFQPLEEESAAPKAHPASTLNLLGSTTLFVTIRPENQLLILAVFCGGVFFAAHTLAPWSLKSIRLRLVALYGLVIVSPVLALFAWRRAIFHAWFPHPVLAKAGGDPRWAGGWKYLIHSVQDFQPAVCLLLPVALAIVFASCLRRPTRPLAGFVATLAAAGVLFICASGGDWMSCGRFLANQLPVWWIAIVASLSLVLVNQLRTVAWCIAGLGIINTWFLVGLARTGGANGYPLSAALRVIPAARKQYQLQHFSFLELSNKSHLRDALLSDELNRVVSRVLQERPEKLWIASGQAGGVPYHTFSVFPGRLRFIDFWGLTDSSAMPCIPASALRRSSLGVALSPELLFQYRESILRDCGIPMADIVFNTSLHAGTKKGLEARGYKVIYYQHGAMPNFKEPSILRGGTSMDAYIAVRRELAETLHLSYHEVSWSISG